MPDRELDKIFRRKYEEILRHSNGENGSTIESQKEKLYHLNDSDFDSFLIEKKDLVVDFYADWCGPCKIMAPIFEQISNELSSKVAFAKVNVDENHVISGRYDIMGVPTILYFRGGRMIDKTVGAVPKEILRQKIREVFAV